MPVRAALPSPSQVSLRTANDIASGAYNTYAIRQAFAAAYDALTTALHTREDAIRRADRHNLPRFYEDPSLLGAIYDICR